MKDKMTKIIKSVKSKKFIAILVAACVAMGAVAGFVVFSGREKKGADAVADEVEKVYITRENLKKTISLTGTVAATESYSLTSDVADTTVKKVCVKVGDRVKKGDVIAELDPTTIQQALDLAESNLDVTIQKNALDVEAAQRAYSLAVNQANALAERKALEESEAKQKAILAQEEYGSALQKKENAGYEDLDDQSGEDSIKDQLNHLTEVSRKMAKRVSNAQSEYDEACNRRDELKTKMDEAAEDYEEDASLESAYNSAKSAYEAAQREVEQAKEKLDTAKNDQTDNANELEDANKDLTEFQGDLTEAKSKKTELDTAYETAKTNLETAKANQRTATYGIEDQKLENAKALADSKDQITAAMLAGKSQELTARQEVEKLKKQLKKCSVKAPADGVVISVDVKEGEEYKGTQIAMISDDSGYKVQSTADQYDIGDIQQGMKALIATDTTGEENMKGYLSFVSPIPVTETAPASGEEGGVTTTSTKSTQSGYPIEASIKNPSDRLRIGMTAKLTIVVEKAKGALALPENCIQTGEEGDYVEIWDEKTETSTIIPVTRGLETDYYVQVIGDGLEEGMCVKMPADAFSDDSSDYEDEL